MPRIGEYHVPFPYAPYALQEDAVTRLSRFLREEAPLIKRAVRTTDSCTPDTHPGEKRTRRHASDDGDGHECESEHGLTRREPQEPFVPPLAILESPTGTGKSQMLLNAVLASVFDVVTSDALPHVTATENATANVSRSVDAQAAAPAPPPSLDALIQRQRLEDELQRVRHDRRRRVRAARRHLRVARQYMKQFLSSESAHASRTAALLPAELLIEQDPVQFLRENAPGMYEALMRQSDGHGSVVGLAFSSSSGEEEDGASNSDDDEKQGGRHGHEDNDAEDDDADERVSRELATLVPLRSPKVFFASRTHTQLDQLRRDFTVTSFATARVRPRRDETHSDFDANTNTEARGTAEPISSTSTSRRLRAVHVASRQQLCVNPHIRAEAARRANATAMSAGESGGAGAVLNELCLAAMQYEYSPAGRTARRRQRKEEAQHGGGTIATTSFSGIVPDTHSSSPAFGVDKSVEASATREKPLFPDMEDVGSRAAEASGEVTSGCAFCGEQRLRGLLEYIQQQQRAEEKGTPLTSEGDVAGETHGQASPTAFHLSLESMKKLGQELQACPYLVTRLLVRGADLLFIPYGYLVDEAQREALLRGVVTNPATESEQQQQQQQQQHEHAINADGSIDVFGDEDGVVSGSTALGSVLYRRRRVWNASKRSTATHNKAEDDVAAITALNAPPNFAGSTLVFDEAHNLADHCRTTSTAAVTVSELRLTRGLVHAYLTRYEKRLVITSKQRLRELIVFIDGVLRGVESTARAGQTTLNDASSSAAAASAAVLPFTAFLFNAGVDHVDVFAFLSFLVDTRLFIKLQGMVAYALQREQEEALTAAPQRKTLPPPGSSSSTQKGGGGDNGPEPLSALFMALAGMLPGSTSTEPLARPACVSAAVRALRRVDHFLRWFYLSDDSTRVLLTHVPASHAGGGVEVKLVQRHPAAHTLLPVLRAARATVLAGGTMQPLTLTCEPLLSCQRTSGFTETCVSRVRPVRFIREGHVVPSSSVAVWALGAGPSGRSLNFRHGGRLAESATAAPLATTTTTPISPALHELFTELALTLLNVARVMPPAGLVCFFTSFDFEARFSQFLQQHASLYWDPLNAVKKVFREGDVRRGGGSGSGETIEGLMKAYRDWIYNDDSSRAGISSRSRRGAILFAVMGGRLSEGINFADDLGRCVMVVGLPFASPSDPELRLHLRHLAVDSGSFSALVADESGSTTVNHMDEDRDEVSHERSRVPLPSDPHKKARVESSLSVAPERRADPADKPLDDVTAAFTAQEWSLYTDMCMRVVNQSIGRCIRHANDYATVLLIDARYVERRGLRQRVSSWLQPSLAVATGGFPQCIRGVKQFFDGRRASTSL